MKQRVSTQLVQNRIPLTKSHVCHRLARLWHTWDLLKERDSGRVLFCQKMKDRARAKDVFYLANAFLRENSIPWDKAGSVCREVRPPWGHRSGFVALMKQVAPHITSNQRAIHKYALSCKTLSLELKSALDSVVSDGTVVECPPLNWKFVFLIYGHGVNRRNAPWARAFTSTSPARTKFQAWAATNLRLKNWKEQLNLQEHHLELQSSQATISK